MISMGTALNRDGQMEGAWFGDIGFAIRNSESFSKALPMGIGSLKPRGDMVASRKVVHRESATDALSLARRPGSCGASKKTSRSTRKAPLHVLPPSSTSRSVVETESLSLTWVKLTVTSVAFHELVGFDTTWCRFQEYLECPTVSVQEGWHLLSPPKFEHVLLPAIINRQPHLSS